MRTAWQAIEEFTAATIERARRLPPDQLDESVDGEWSFLQTLRHLVFATDRWITGPVLRDAERRSTRWACRTRRSTRCRPGVFDLDARPTFDEVLAVRRGRMDRVAALPRAVDGAELNRLVPSPNGGKTRSRSCLHVVFREEWWHDQYANRDLAVLERR